MENLLCLLEMQEKLPWKAGSILSAVLVPCLCLGKVRKMVTCNLSKFNRCAENNCYTVNQDNKDME